MTDLELKADTHENNICSVCGKPKELSWAVDHDNNEICIAIVCDCEITKA